MRALPTALSVSPPLCSSRREDAEEPAPEPEPPEPPEPPTEPDSAPGTELPLTGGGEIVD